jgi:hypothetical protein
MKTEQRNQTGTTQTQRKEMQRPNAERMKGEQSAALRATAERIRRAPELAAALVGIASSVRAIAVLEVLADRLESGDLEDS